MSIISNLIGRKIELFVFEYRGEFYRYTSSDREVTSNGEEYIPLTIKRSDLQASSEQAKKELTIDCTVEFPIVDFFKLLTPQNIKFTLFETLRSDPDNVHQLYNGILKSCVITGSTAKLTAQPFSGLLTRDICRYSYSTLCNHNLYGEGCGLNIEDHTFDFEVLSVESDGITINFTTQLPVGNFVNGVMRLDSGEARMVIEEVGSGLKVISPFENINTGDLVRVSLGCDRTVSACKGFNNYDNYLGFRYIPNRNPYINGL